MESLMLKKMQIKSLATLALAVLMLVLLIATPGAQAAPEESGIADLFPLTAYDKAALDGLDVEADLMSGAVEVLYNGSVTTVTLKQPRDRLVFYIGTDYYLAEPSSVPTGTFVIQNETGEVYRLADYYYAAEFHNFPRVFNGAAAANVGPNATDAQKYAFLSGLDASAWWALNRAKYFGAGASYADLSVLNDAINDVELYGQFDTIPETSDDMIGLAAYYYANMIRVTFDQVGYPVTGDMTPAEKTDICLYNYLYKSNANRARMLNAFFPNAIGPSGLSAAMAYSFDGPRIGNGYQGVSLLNSFIFVLERVREPEPTPTPTPSPTPSTSPFPGVSPTPDINRPPFTGDAFRITGFLLIAVAAAVLLITLLLRRRGAKK